MATNEESNEQNRSSKSLRNAIFNLIALVSLLIIIIVLHNTLKKPSGKMAKDRPSSKPAAAVELNTARKPKPAEKAANFETAVVDFEQELKKQDRPQPSLNTRMKTTALKRNSEFAVEYDLDNELSRLKYLEENKKMNLEQGSKQEKQIALKESTTRTNYSEPRSETYIPFETK